MTDSTIIDNTDDWVDFFRDLNYSSIVAITDTNTETHCLPYVINTYLEEPIPNYTLQSGESSKNLEEASNIWNWLIKQNVDRQAVILAIGGGMVTDLAGFAASTYKRGVRTIYFPTTNLAMCDAAIGGKTGLNFQGIKNQIGSFHSPSAIVLDTYFLDSLPKKELYSGLFETVKHAMIGDVELWNTLTSSKFNIKSEEAILRSIKVKRHIVAQDFKEIGIRQALNFGHTVGHAIEAKSAQTERILLHGEAIAFGMLAEAWISTKLVELDDVILNQLEKFILSHLSFHATSFFDAKDYLDLMIQDKKNHHGNTICSLIRGIGLPIIDRQVEEKMLCESIEFAKTRLVK